MKNHWSCRRIHSARLVTYFTSLLPIVGIFQNREKKVQRYRIYLHDKYPGFSTSKTNVVIFPFIFVQKIINLIFEQLFEGTRGSISPKVERIKEGNNAIR